jgi:hypothetical protein
MVGFSDAKASYYVNLCARFVSRSFGPIIVGINDSEPTNNTGDATFVVNVSPPTAAKCLGGATESCPVQ